MIYKDGSTMSKKVEFQIMKEWEKHLERAEEKLRSAKKTHAGGIAVCQ